uniref:Venom protein n=1 Tax=Haemonchus contortus TaxID=6289 RepID=A0A7I4YXI3_HAECO
MRSLLLLTIAITTIYCGPAKSDTKSATKKAVSDECFPTKMCYSDADCPNGACAGLFVGTCNCMECIDLARCDDDSMCGGLRGACDLNNDLCNCTAGYMRAGFQSLPQALITLCERKTCTHETADKDCFGLPCTAGTCVCFKDKHKKKK